MLVRQGLFSIELAALSLILSSAVYAAPAASPDGVWRDDDRAFAAASGANQVWIQPDVFRAVVLNRDALQAVMASAPREFSRQAPAIFQLPRPEGGFSQFKIQESPIMEPGLAAK